MSSGAPGYGELWVGVKVSQFSHLLIRLPWVHTKCSLTSPFMAGIHKGDWPNTTQRTETPTEIKKVGRNAREQALGRALHICTSRGSSHMVVASGPQQTGADPEDAVWTHALLEQKARSTQRPYEH